ncbi:hypothetical protein D8B26_004248 [Coccidioides posadasii str. Silveira]|uniref:uncharacterized protein n=1 Tax=Coccidioides posadasii (strain RMSCC 757 / Silveira) TaxID=443226 RepID=UPI001BF160C6|nr:hypothetical protein D8B26_004248 [Coccidioides posadasii str. Silveira]
MTFSPLSAGTKPSVLFRAECRANTSFREGYLCARGTIHGGVPSREDFDDRLSWKKRPTRFLSFFSSWRRVMKRQEYLEGDEKKDIVVIALWAKSLAGVYSAKEVAYTLGYSDTGPDPRKKLRNHHDEYLVEGGIAADEYCILAIFEGGGPEREVTFECPFYRISATIPSGFFPGRKSNNALEDIEDEIYSHSGVRDDRKRDEL